MTARNLQRLDDRPLNVRPCRGLCSWRPDRRPAEPPRFRCGGCGSQWDRTQAWMPRDADGSVSPAVRAEASRRLPR